MRALIPWWARIGAKLILSRLPAGYDLWRRLNVFAHGAMDRPDYALRVFQQHYAHVQTPSGGEFAALELGPGDSLTSALIAAAHGASHTYLVDVGAFARSDPAVYHYAARRLGELGVHPPALDDACDLDSLLRTCRSSYHTEGLRSLRQIPAASVDFIWSHAVLEHVRRSEFLDFVRETRRIVRAGGVCSHQIDLQDHLGGALNNLRISSRWWETGWMASSGFYTNRLRMPELIDMFESAGFSVKGVNAVRWEVLPTPRHLLAREFQHFAAEDLLVKTFSVVLHPV